jgi:membrane-associated phospholipid phosphatase
MSGATDLKQPGDVRFRVAMAALFAAAAAFALIAEQVATQGPIVARDQQVSAWLHVHGNPALTALLLKITQVHSMPGILILSLVVGLFLWRNGDRFWVLSLALAVPAGLLLNAALKLLFDRARPTWDDPLLTLTTRSFPSGHATGATLFYGFLACYLVWPMKDAAARALVVAACAAMVVLVGFSRIYLGVHYLSDVLAGMSFGTAWLALCMIAARALARHRGATAGG